MLPRCTVRAARSCLLSTCSACLLLPMVSGAAEAEDVVAAVAQIAPLGYQVKAVFGRRGRLVAKDAGGAAGRRHVHHVLPPEVFVTTGRQARLPRFQGDILAGHRCG